MPHTNCQQVEKTFLTTNYSLSISPPFIYDAWHTRRVYLIFFALIRTLLKVCLRLADKIGGSDLHMECAILYGKLEEHDKALHILVHVLKDFAAAEDYCAWNSENRGIPYRQKLFHMLLAVYLNSSSAEHELIMAAVDLLNSHAADFDAALVLRLLPDNWSVQLLSSFLTGAMRESIHARRTSQIALGLAEAENLTYKHEKVSGTVLPIV